MSLAKSYARQVFNFESQVTPNNRILSLSERCEKSDAEEFGGESG